ncbi:hypothetical protein V8C42DRAFT_359972 [Trichoderma barbatum]
MSVHQEEHITIRNMPSSQEEHSIIASTPEHHEEGKSIVTSTYLEADDSASHHHVDSEDKSAFHSEADKQQYESTEDPSDLEPDSSLASQITVVEALLLSGLNISVNNTLEALQLIEVLVDTVTSKQIPPFLKIMKHNVDTNAYKKLSKGKKATSSAGQEDSLEKITPHAACARCQHDPVANQPALTLRSCLNCQSVEYCSVQCQLTDWKAHRNLFCVNPTVIPIDTLAKPHRVPFLKTHITNPFARLAKGIWLHDRHKQDVYALLIDSFRLREADDFNYGGITNNDSVYSGRVTSCPAFRRFLYQAEAKGLMPPWWSDQKRVECLTKGIDRGEDNYHDLYAMTQDIEIVVVYEDAIMTMQLRMFSESVLGKGAGGSDGRLMLQKMVVAEEAARILSK